MIRALRRRAGVDIREPADRYEKLGRLRHLRNAIVHQGGWVNSENIRRLQRFGYREGQYIDLDATEFASTRALVYETCRDMARGFPRVSP